MGVIITTTNNISCYSIKEYRGTVCANQEGRRVSRLTGDDPCPIIGLGQKAFEIPLVHERVTFQLTEFNRH